MLQNSTQFDSLPPVQAKVAAALASGQTVSAAALEAGVSRSTVYNWMKVGAFKAAHDEIRQDLSEALRDQLHELEVLALDTIRQLMSDPKTPPSVRLKAALSILQRPKYPAQSWSLPEPVYPPRQEAMSHELASLLKNQDIREKEQRMVNVARNAPCPCGSNNKYKRCCGKNAPPILSAAA